MKLGEYKVTIEKDIVHIRYLIKKICSAIGFNKLDTIRITTAVSELTRNICEHASGGLISFHLLKRGKKVGLGLIFEDKGPGIKEIDNIMKGKFRSNRGMGIGLLGAKRLMDDFKINSNSDGTKIEIVKWFGESIKSFQNLQSAIESILTEISEETAFEILKTQNRDLILIFEELKNKNIQLNILNEELEKRNIKLREYMMELERSTEEIRDTVNELERSNKELELFIC